MKKTLLAFATASAMLAVPVYANEAAAPKPLPEFLTKENSATLSQAIKELRAAQGNERNMVKLLDAQTRFEFSPELRPKLKEIFGTERPLTTQRLPATKGQINYVSRLAPYLWVQGNGTDFSWTELTAKISTDKTGRSMNAAAAWPSLVIARQEGSVHLQNMSMISKHLRGADGVSYGTATFGIGSIVVRGVAVGGKEASELMRFEDIQARSESVRRGSVVEIASRSSTKAIVFGAERVERVNLGFRLTNIPAKTMVELDQSLRAQQASELAPQAAQELMMRSLKEFGDSLVLAGAVLNIDDISAAYRGNVAALKGYITFQKVLNADMDSVPRLLKKLVAHFDLRVPVALIKDVGRAIASKSVPPDTPDAAKQIEAGADGLVSVVVGKAVTNGFAVIEKGELRSSIDFKNGQLTMNGKVIDLPALNIHLDNKGNEAPPAK